jgi:SAM-dependent methyltransferase
LTVPGPEEASPKQDTFSAYSSQYCEAVQSSIDFIGRDVAFFTRAKIYHLRQLGDRSSKGLATSSVLDVGCGLGLTDEYLLPHVGELTGVDVSESMVEGAARRNPDAKYTTYDGQRLPFGDDRFDLVFAINVVHHVDPVGWDAFLSELLRVTAVDGMTVVIEHNPINPLTRRSVDLCEFDADAVLVGRRRLIKGLRSAGAESVGHRYIVFAPFGGDRTRRLERALGWCPAGAQHLAWGRKFRGP